MPELPEVETVRRGLERTIVGKTVAAVEIRVPKLFPDDRQLIDEMLIDAKVVAIERRAKVLLIDLSTHWTLAIHLKMTGQLIVASSDNQAVSVKQLVVSEGAAVASKRYPLSAKRSSVAFVGGHPEKAYEQPLPHKHTHVIIEFSDLPRPRLPDGQGQAGGTTLYFNDLRKFGWLRLFPHEVVNHTGHQTLPQFLESLNLGPEPLSRDFTIEYFSKLLKDRKISIKQLLLEQKGISGIGNIYADEALFRAGIWPQRSASSVKRSEIERLHRAIREVLELGIEYGGTTKNTYRNVEGTMGAMQDHLMVYGREGDPCRQCQTPIERIKIGQRSAHFCPRCQPR